ncbi:hypothetical protein CRUP_013393 [Coryphaenoides rupestris]|nr:hypothetical protein CRUP_013393 [Coryphaenoides rupestris]
MSLQPMSLPQWYTGKGKQYNHRDFMTIHPLLDKSERRRRVIVSSVITAEETCPATRPGNIGMGQVKRVVSCKRKTHHHVAVARRKPVAAAAAVAGRPYSTGNKENQVASLTQGPYVRLADGDAQWEILHVDPWEFPLIVNKHQGGGTGSKHTDGSSVGQLTRDHISVVSVLSRRNLRLKVALTLWRRNVGELLTYFLSIDEDSSGFTIGCCVDLFPFIKQVLSSPYEGNFQVFNQQLVNLWHHDPGLALVRKTPPDLVKVMDSYLSQLT